MPPWHKLTKLFAGLVHDGSGIAGWLPTACKRMVCMLDLRVSVGRHLPNYKITHLLYWYRRQSRNRPLNALPMILGWTRVCFLPQ